MKTIIYGFILLLTLMTGNVIADDKISPQTIAGATTIDTRKAKSLFDSGALFVDVRSDKDWSAGRIPDAVHIELKKVFNENSFAEEAKKNEPVVIYCNGEKCLRSSKATAKAVTWGYKNLFYYRDGFPAWKNAGYPVE